MKHFNRNAVPIVRSTYWKPGLNDFAAYGPTGTKELKKNKNK